MNISIDLIYLYLTRISFVTFSLQAQIQKYKLQATDQSKEIERCVASEESMQGVGRVRGGEKFGEC